MTIVQLTSRIESVKVYSAGATVTRFAELSLTHGKLPEQVEIAELPLSLDDRSVRVKVEVERGTAPLANDVRIGLAVPPPPEIPSPPLDEEIRAATAQVQQLENLITLIENEIEVLDKLHVPNRPKEEPGKAPPPSPTSARLALANFSDEQIRLRLQEARENREKLRLARENLADLEQKQRLASSAKDARPNELRKTAIVSLSYEGDAPDAEVGRLIVEYFVPGARWTPTYVCRLNSAESSASIAVRSLLCQRTGEDWSGVRLELSTAEPLAWCALPELPSLRLGKAQPVSKKSGWRRPPIGVEVLFEDYDRQQEAALLASMPENAIAEQFSSVYVPPLTAVHPLKSQLEIEEEFERGFPAAGAAYGASYADEEPQDPTSLIPLEELQLSTAAYKALKRAQIHSVADLLNLTQEDLQQIQYLSQQSAQELTNALQQRFGITLSSEKNEEIASVRSLVTRSIPAPAPQFLTLKRGLSTGTTQSKSDREVFDSLLAYNMMRLGEANNRAKRGKLSIEQQQEVYIESLKRQQVVVNFDVLEVVQQAVNNAQSCLRTTLPPGGINVRTVAGSFDYAYCADGRVDVPSDGQFHSVALTGKTTDVDLRYIVVPREDTNVFRIAQLRNPLLAPLLAGSADVYVDDEYILSTHIATVPPQGHMELGLGVEQSIKVARNTSYQEVRSGETIVAFNELRHCIKIDITNLMPRSARIEVRERLPVPAEGAKVDVQVEQVIPDWEKYKQEERSAPIVGGYRWLVEVPAKEQKNLSVEYTIKTFVDSELIGGNRREE
ncbi:hypothetical protein WA1_46145 [Scytonema hofmannii PCC 7110]|uniref:DUF4139 domain-containing protein n=1 Tax=Scytonema hofmannii PCC 7110 TaxID=128403 RepID=A0A139WX75_9CYAN|nr:mucoidy inhibitor MuiA family protein [Scytonema hofmannii]KYC37030.1 hypothetical protein WA1_46145 [Scytonema hofmannii PCC 7110]